MAFLQEAIASVRRNLTRFFKSQAESSIDNGGESIISNTLATSHYIEIYMVHPTLGKLKTRSEFARRFMKMLTTTQPTLHAKPVFFDKAEAIDFVRFMDESFAIARVIVNENAIQGQNGELLVNLNHLRPHNIHGCYPAWSNGAWYFTNPGFDQNLLEHLSSSAE